MIFSSMFSIFAIISVIGCSGTDYTQQIKEADKDLRNGQIEKALTSYLAVLKEEPMNVDAATAAAHASMLKGDYEKANDYLVAVEEKAGERIGEIKLRRALIAQQRGKWDDAQKHALDSQTDFGKLLAAEVYLMDGEKEDALSLLKEISKKKEKALAKKYIELLEDEDDWIRSLAEVQASWALKDYKIAVEGFTTLLANISKDFPNYEQEVLLWAGRAVAIGDTKSATILLERDFSALPEGQKWRVDATKAIITCTKGRTDECVEIFASLEQSAPPQGLQDAQATAAMLLAEKDPKGVKKVLQGLEGTAIAQAWWKANEVSKAKKVAENGMFRNFLKGEM